MKYNQDEMRIIRKMRSLSEMVCRLGGTSMENILPEYSEFVFHTYSVNPVWHIFPTTRVQVWSSASYYGNLLKERMLKLRDHHIYCTCPNLLVVLFRNRGYRAFSLRTLIAKDWTVFYDDGEPWRWDEILKECPHWKGDEYSNA